MPLAPTGLLRASNPGPMLLSGHRLVLAAAAILALLWQCLVVQVHVHPDAGGAWRQAPASARVAGNAIGQSHPVHGSGECPLCRELSLSGNFVGAGGARLHGPAASFAPAVLLPLPPLAEQSRSHRWQSRGPPARS